jgi:hypothetical protein
MESLLGVLVGAAITLISECLRGRFAFKQLKIQSANDKLRMQREKKEAVYLPLLNEFFLLMGDDAPDERGQKLEQQLIELRPLLLLYASQSVREQSQLVFEKLEEGYDWDDIEKEFDQLIEFMRADLAVSD